MTAAVTPQTSRNVIERFNQFNLGCISQLMTCRHPVDMAPALWESAIRDTASQRFAVEDEVEYCNVSAPIRVREANDVLLVEVLSDRENAGTMSGEEGQQATVRVLKVLKNGRETPPGTTLVFSNRPKAIDTTGGGQPDLVKGRQYFFLYNRPHPNQIDQWVGLHSCHGLLNTPTNEAEVMAALKLDPSAGEPYDYWNEKYTD